MCEADVTALRSAGFDDRAIVDANQVASYFNYVNRIADGLGVQLESSGLVDASARYRLPPAEAKSGLPEVSGGELTWISVEQMREVDRVAIDTLGLSLDGMMENAGLNMAMLVREILGGSVSGRRIALLAGPGGNGGGGMAAARHVKVEA